MERPKRSRHLLQGKKRIKAKTNKLVDRLTYIPSKHKQKFTRELRNRLQKKSIIPPKSKECPNTLKFGSHNINGLDLEASWAVNDDLMQVELLNNFIYVMSHLKNMTIMQTYWCLFHAFE